MFYELNSIWYVHVWSGLVKNESSIYVYIHDSLILKLLRNTNMYVWGEPDHKIIEIRPEFLEQKANVLLIAQPTTLYVIFAP